MSDTFTAVKTTPTTVPNNTYVEASYGLGDGVLLYQPDQNAFIALYPDEWLEMRADAHLNKTAIDELQEANRDVTEKSLKLHALQQQPNSAKEDLAKANDALAATLDTLAKKSEAAKTRVEAISDQTNDPNKLVELVPLTMKRLTHTTVPVYVSARHLKKALNDRRIYLVEGSEERRREPKTKLIKNWWFDGKEVRRRLVNQVRDETKFEKKWKLSPKDADQFSGILTDWAKVMGTNVTALLERTQKEAAEGLIGADKLDPNNPHRNIDLKSEAQFLRWAGGAGAEAIFMPFQGKLNDARDTTLFQKFKRGAKAAQFSVKANAEASFAIGEAKIETTAYIPHAAGWHLTPVSEGDTYDFGFFRLRADLKLYAMAGASLAMEASAAVMINADRQGLVGRPLEHSKATAKMGAKGEAKVFIGLKEGIELAGAVQWLNPEGFSDMKAPKKVDPNKAIAEYVDIASVRCEANLTQGLLANYGFEIDYRNGYFVVAAKGGACFGMGGAGGVSGKVGVEEIGKLFMCIAHQLKQADYKKLAGLMGSTAFGAYIMIFYMVVAGGKQFEDFVGLQLNTVEQKYNDVKNVIRQMRDGYVRELYRKMSSGWGPYAYLPPECRGAIIADIASVINEPGNFDNIDLRANAAFVINELLSTTQSLGHLRNTLDRVNLAMGTENSRSQGIQLINAVVENTAFANCIRRCEAELAMVTPLQGRPFLRNDLPEIYLAKFPLSHPAYQIV